MPVVIYLSCEKVQGVIGRVCDGYFFGGLWQLHGEGKRTSPPSPFFFIPDDKIARYSCVTSDKSHLLHIEVAQHKETADAASAVVVPHHHAHVLDADDIARAGQTWTAHVTLFSASQAVAGLTIEQKSHSTNRRRGRHRMRMTKLELARDSRTTVTCIPRTRESQKASRVKKKDPPPARAIVTMCTRSRPTMSQ
jgi:hypothetical protein